MNWNSSLLAALGLFSVALFPNCSGFDSGGGGEVIHNPTVDDMVRYESQWGMKPRQVKPRYRPAGPGDFMDETPRSSSQVPGVEAQPVQPQPQLQEPAPDPIPAPQSSAPPVPPVPDPATLNKLR